MATTYMLYVLDQNWRAKIDNKNPMNDGASTLRSTEEFSKNYNEFTKMRQKNNHKSIYNNSHNN